MFIDKDGEVKIPSYLLFFPIRLDMLDGCFYIAVVGSLIDFEGFLLYALCGEGPIPFGRNFDAVHVGILASGNPDFLVVGNALFLGQGVDGEYLHLLDIAKSENG